MTSDEEDIMQKGLVQTLWCVNVNWSSLTSSLAAAAREEVVQLHLTSLGDVAQSDDGPHCSRARS